MHHKDFDKWNKEKQNIEKKEREFFAHPREIWWCSLGINIGTETDGKNDNFERPVLVVKVFSKETLRVIPLTTKQKEDDFHVGINYNDIVGYANITHTRTISIKRLSRKMCKLNKNDFNRVILRLRELV